MAGPRGHACAAAAADAAAAALRDAVRSGGASCRGVALTTGNGGPPFGITLVNDQLIPATASSSSSTAAAAGIEGVGVGRSGTAIGV